MLRPRQAPTPIELNFQMSQAFYANNESPSTWLKNTLCTEVVALGALIPADTQNSFLIVGDSEAIQNPASGKKTPSLRFKNPHNPRPSNSLKS